MYTNEESQKESKIMQAVEQLKKGDAKAFEALYSQTYRYVYSRAKCMFSDEQEIQDLVQEVYLAVYRNISSLKANEGIFAWLRTITFYQGTKMLKKQRKELLLSEESEELFEAIPDEEEVENDYMDKKDIEIIRACIDRLSDEQRTVILAYYYDNLKVDEISNLFAISAGTVKSRLYLARKNLKDFIEEQEKKQGYKLHSFGSATLALAIGSWLQNNMEVSQETSKVLFGNICKTLNLSLGHGAKAGILQAITGMGAKKIAISAAAIISTIVIGGGAVVIGFNANKKDEPEKPIVETTKVVEEEPKVVQQWQKDYAKVLMELLYMPENLENYEAREDGILSEYSTPFSDLYYSGQFKFGLLDVNGDEIPELFVEDISGTYYTDNKYLFTTGTSMEECLLGRIYYADTETNEIVSIFHTDLSGDHYWIYKMNNDKVDFQFLFRPNEVPCNHEEYEEHIEQTYSMSESEDYSQEGTLISKEEYDNLLAQYSTAKNFPLETCELTMENIEAQLGIQIPNKYKTLYQYLGEVYNAGRPYNSEYFLRCEEINFNDDNEPDYVLSYNDCSQVLLVSGEDEYYKYGDLMSGTHSSYYTYIEKTGKLIRNGHDNPGQWLEIYEINEMYELVCTGWFEEVYEQKSIGEPTSEEDYDITYKYHEDGATEEMTETEWWQRIGAMGEAIDLYGPTDCVLMSEMLSKIDISVQLANTISQGNDKTTLEKATYFTTASASSTLPAEGKYNHSPTNVLTNDASCWVEGASGYGEGEWIKLELPEKQLLSGLKIINGYAGGTAKQYAHNSKITEAIIEFSDGQSTTRNIVTYIDESRNTVQTIEFNKPVETSYVIITIKNVLAGECEDTCLTYVAPY